MANTAASQILAEIDKRYKDVRWISPKPRTRWWRQVHKGWKRGNTLRHGVRERHLRAQAEEPLRSLCPAFGGDTQRRFWINKAQLVWQRRLWGQNPNASTGSKLMVSL